MAYDAKAIEVMIASPSDVSDERQAVREVIAEWNAVHSRREAICLMSVGWETHSSPELAGRPQGIINERILENADLLVGIFWTRVGSPTGKSISGSVEEIERHLAAGKPVMLYFSTAPVVASSLDIEQFESLEQFKEWAKGQGLIEQFENLDQFRSKFRSQLQLTLNANEHLKRIVSDASTDFVSIFNDGVRTSDIALDEDAQAVLVAAFKEQNGRIVIRRHLGGTRINAGETSFGDQADRRSVARWEAAIEKLYELGLTRDPGGKGEIFELTHSGYQMAENIIEDSQEC